MMATTTMRARRPSRIGRQADRLCGWPGERLGAELPAGQGELLVLSAMPRLARCHRQCGAAASFQREARAFLLRQVEIAVGLVQREGLRRIRGFAGRQHCRGARGQAELIGPRCAVSTHGPFRLRVRRRHRPRIHLRRRYFGLLNITIAVADFYHVKIIPPAAEFRVDFVVSVRPQTSTDVNERDHGAPGRGDVVANALRVAVAAVRDDVSGGRALHGQDHRAS